jgi:hypothetical protein
MKRAFFGVVLLIVLAVVCTSIGDDGDSGGGGGNGGDEAVQRVSVPGEATIEEGDTRTTTRILGASVRTQGTEQFSRPAEGRVFLTFNAEVENTGSEGDVDLNASVYRLQVPTGEILDYQAYSADGDQAFQSGTTLPPGVKRAGTITWEVPPPVSGQSYVLLWKPSFLDDQQAQFTYVHP